MSVENCKGNKHWERTAVQAGKHFSTSANGSWITSPPWLPPSSIHSRRHLCVLTGLFFIIWRSYRNRENKKKMPQTIIQASRGGDVVEGRTVHEAFFPLFLYLFFPQLLIIDSLSLFSRQNEPLCCHQECWIHLPQLCCALLRFDCYQTKACVCVCSYYTLIYFLHTFMAARTQSILPICLELCMHVCVCVHLYACVFMGTMTGDDVLCAPTEQQR